MALTSTRLSPWITRITFALALSGCGKPTSVSSSTESGATNPPTVSSTLGTTTITATGASAQSNSPVAGIVVAGATFATVGISMTSAHPRVIAGVCTRISLSISATLGDGSVGVFSVPVPITLAATHGHFYPSSKCTGTAITTVTVPAGESQAPETYFLPPARTGGVNLSADLLSPATALPIATLASANLPLIVQWPPTVVYYAGAANGSGSLVTTDQSIFLNAPYGLADWTAIALYTLPGAGRVPAYICGDAYHQFMTTATACGPPIGYFYNVQVAGSEAVYLVDGGLACIPAFLYYTEPTGQPYGTLLGFSPSVTENHTGYTC